MCMKNALPLDWVCIRGENGVRLNTLAAMHVWNAICDAGRDPEVLEAKHQEIGDGTLALGFYEKEDDDFNDPIPGLGFIVPMGFWYSIDGRMPMNWLFATPPVEYGPPGIGVPDKSIFNWPSATIEGSSNL